MAALKGENWERMFENEKYFLKLSKIQKKSEALKTQVVEIFSKIALVWRLIAPYREHLQR